MYEFKGTYADFVRLFREEGGMYGSFWNHLEVNTGPGFFDLLDPTFFGLIDNWQPGSRLSQSVDLTDWCLSI